MINWLSRLLIDYCNHWYSFHVFVMHWMSWMGNKGKRLVDRYTYGQERNPRNFTSHHMHRLQPVATVAIPEGPESENVTIWETRTLLSPRKTKNGKHYTLMEVCNIQFSATCSYFFCAMGCGLGILFRWRWADFFWIGPIYMLSI